MRREKKSSIDDKVTFGQVLELYKEEQRFKAIKQAYEEKKKKLSTEIRNYMYSKGYSSFDFRSREFGNVKVNKVVRKTIKWDVDKLKKKLPIELLAEIIEREYHIVDMPGLVKYLKSCGVNPKKFKQYISVEEKVNQQAINELSEIGDITAQDIEGCYELKQAEGYLTINAKKEDEQ